MKFKAKLRKIGNGKHIYIPKEIYINLVENQEYEWEVYINKKSVMTEKIKSKLEWCDEHDVWKATCKCK